MKRRPNVCKDCTQFYTCVAPMVDENVCPITHPPQQPFDHELVSDDEAPWDSLEGTKRGGGT